MAFKTIMSPKSPALYPIRIKESLMTTGQEVTAGERALIAETAQGKRIGIKAGETGRVIQIAPEGAILDQRQMILVIETFEASETEQPASKTEQDTARPKAQPKSQAKSEAKTEPQPQNQSRTERPKPEPQRKPDATTGKRDTPKEPEPSATAAAATAPRSKKITFGRLLKGYGYYMLPVIALIVVQAAFPGFLDRVLGSGSGSGSGSVSISGGTSDSDRSAYSDSTDTSTATEAEADTSPVVSFPREQEYAWTETPEMQSLTRMTRDGATRFFDIDMGADGSTLIVGERYGDGYAFSFDDSHTILGEYSSPGPVSDGFALYDLFDASQSTLFAFSAGRRDASRIFKSTRDLENVTRVSQLDGIDMTDFRIQSSDRAGDFGMLWGQKLERNASDSLPIDVPYIIALSEAGEATRTQSHGGWGRWNINTAELPEGYGPTISAGYGDRVFMGSPPEASFITRTVGYKDGEFSIDTIETIDLDLADLMPVGTFSGWRGAVNGEDVGRFEPVALEYDSGGEYSLYAGQFSGTRGQPLPERFNVFLDVGSPDTPSTRLVLARNDSAASDGLVVRDVMALPQGGFAVLMREEKGAPYSAVVRLSSDGAVLSQYIRRDLSLAKMDIGPNDTLHLVGSEFGDSGEEALYLVLQP